MQPSMLEGNNDLQLKRHRSQDRNDKFGDSSVHSGDWRTSRIKVPSLLPVCLKLCLTCKVSVPRSRGGPTRQAGRSEGEKSFIKHGEQMGFNTQEALMAY